MRTSSDSHVGLDKPANLNGVHAYQKMIRADECPPSRHCSMMTSGSAHGLSSPCAMRPESAVS